MSRGRKPKSNDTNLSWQQIFSKNVGKYLQYAIIELGKLDNKQTESGADLLKKIKAEKGKIKKDKELPPIKTEEIPYEIPENWVWCRLGEICNYISNERAEPNKLTPNTWVLDLEDIEKETSKLLCKIRFSERNSLSTKSVFEKGDVLYSKLRPYLDKVIVADEDGVCTTEILPLQIYGNINPYYLRYALKRSDFLNYVNSVTKGMKMPRLGTNEGQLALMPLPPISEQQKIVDFLTDFENDNLKEDGYYFNQEVEQKVIELHESQLKGFEIANELTYQLSLVKNLRQQLLQDAVQGKLVKNGVYTEGGQKNVGEVSNLADVRASETGSQLLQRIKKEKEQLIKDKKLKKEKELPPIKAEEIPFEIPDDWVWCRGEDVANYIDPQPSHRTPPESSDGVPYIAMSDIKKDGRLDFISARKVSNDTLIEHQNRYTLEEGDFIFGKIGTIGKPVKLTSPFNYTLSANVILIQPKREVISHDYLFYFLCSPTAEKNLIENKSTMSYPVFGMGKARNMPIPLPPLAEQRRIVEKVESLMSLCAALETSIGASVRENEALLQQVLREALQG